MLIRILSDLHRQINRKYPLEIENKDIFTLIAGDMGYDFKENADWIRNNVKKGAFVSGNHDAYGGKEYPIDDVKKYFHEQFPLNSDITYFDYDVGVISKEIGENILLIADVLYTDYNLKIYREDKKLTKKQRQERNMFRATPKMSGSYMNDFMFFTRNRKFSNDENRKWMNLPDGIYYISPKQYLDHHNKAFKKIDEIVKNNPNKDIILMTHHCLSTKCISAAYEKNGLNASYVSDRDSWIKKHSNIKLIVSGHVHNTAEFHVGKTLYVMNPLGYCRSYEHKKYNEKTKECEMWTPNFFVDTETWEVKKEPFENPWEDIEKNNFNALWSAFI